MIFRVQKNENYTTMSNYHLRDKNLSLKAKGLLSWMLSNDDDWDYSIEGIVKCCKEGETTINTALRELQKCGYVEIVKCKPNKDNNRIHYEYNVYEKSQGVDFLGLESQDLENQGQINTKERNTNIINKSISKDIDTKFQFGAKQDKPKKKSLYDKCLDMIDDYTDNEILRNLLVQALKIFLENSREAGLNFYTNHFKGKLNSLSKFSDDVNIQIKIVQQTVDNGWNGFYQLKSIVRKTGNFAEDVEHLQGGLNKQASKKGGQNESEKF